MPDSAKSTVVITGASGVIGRALAADLAADHHVIGLGHSDVTIPEATQVHQANMSEHRLGLSEKDWQEIAERADVIVHSAALTEWGQPPERYQAINIDGTERVVELAVAAGAPVHYLSTCFVHAVELGTDDQLGPDNVVRPYIRSKFAAERLLARSGVPHSIYRPTNLVGDSKTGASTRPQIVQAMSDWLCRGKAPFFPAHRGNLVDIVSLDETTRAVAGAIRAGDLGELYWITRGKTAMTVDTAQDVLLEHSIAHGGRMKRVPVADPSEPLPVSLDEIPVTSRLFLKVLIDVSEVTRACGGVLPTSLPDLRAKYDMPDASDVDSFRRSLGYWAAQRKQPKTTESVA